MSKREHRGQPKPHRQPQIERRPHQYQTPYVDPLNQPGSQLKFVQKPKKPVPEMHLPFVNGTFLTLLLAFLFVESDVAALQVFSARFDAHNFYEVHVLFFSLCAVIFAEYAFWRSRMSWFPQVRHQYAAKEALRNWMFDVGRIALKTYAAVVGLHLLSWFIAVANHQSDLEYSIFVTAFEAVILGIGFHMASIYLRGFFWQYMKRRTPASLDPFANHPEMDNVIATDANYDYFLDADGEIEQVKHHDR